MALVTKRSQPLTPPDSTTPDVASAGPPAAQGYLAAVQLNNQIYYAAVPYEGSPYTALYDAGGNQAGVLRHGDGAFFSSNQFNPEKPDAMARIVGSTRQGDPNRIDLTTIPPGARTKLDPGFKAEDAPLRDAVTGQPIPGTGGQAPAPTAPGTANPRAELDADIDKFYKLMMAPVGSPEWQEYEKQLTGATMGAITRSQAGRGIQGPAAEAGAARGVAEVLTGSQLNRTQLGGEILGLKSRNDLTREGLGLEMARIREGARQFDRGLGWQMEQAEVDSDNNLWRTVGGLAGAGLGSLGFFGGPALAAVTIPAGAALGSGLGGALASKDDFKKKAPGGGSLWGGY